MNEEIDIIELLKRVKEGKAPKEIFANGICYQYQDGDIECLYQGHCGEDTLWWLDEVTLFTPIQILDKPMIEELPVIICYENDINKTLIQKNRDKINEIIKFINEQN